MQRGPGFVTSPHYKTTTHRDCLAASRWTRLSSAIVRRLVRPGPHYERLDMECEVCRWYRVEFEEIDRYQDDAEGYGRVPVCQAPQNDDRYAISNGSCPWRKEWDR